MKCKTLSARAWTAGDKYLEVHLSATLREVEAYSHGWKNGFKIAKKDVRKAKNEKTKSDPKIALLNKLYKLSVELCDAIDAQSDDVGGYRRPIDIIWDIGPLTDQIAKLDRSKKQCKSTILGGAARCDRKSSHKGDHKY